MGGTAVLARRLKWVRAADHALESGTDINASCGMFPTAFILFFPPFQIPLLTTSPAYHASPIARAPTPRLRARAREDATAAMRASA